MFENDRFGPGADYASTYSAIGGRVLSPGRLTDIVSRLCAHLLAVEDDPSQYDGFPRVSEVLRHTERDPDTRDSTLRAF